MHFCLWNTNESFLWMLWHYSQWSPLCCRLGYLPKLSEIAREIKHSHTRKMRSAEWWQFCVCLNYVCLFHSKTGQAMVCRFYRHLKLIPFMPIKSWQTGDISIFMKTSLNGNLFRVTGHLCGEFTGLRWIHRIKASDAELLCFLWSALE